MHDRGYYIRLIQEFLIELHDAAYDKVVSVREFSPGNWFKDNGVTDTYLPAKVLEYLTDTYIIRNGERAGTLIKWKVSESNIDFTTLAENCYEYFLLFREGKRVVKEKKIIRIIKKESNIIPQSKRFNLLEEVFIMYKNRVHSCTIVGLGLSQIEALEASPIVVRVYSKEFNKEDDRYFDVSSNKVFRDIKSLLESLAATAVTKIK